MAPLRNSRGYGTLRLVIRIGYLFYKELRDDKAFIRAAGMAYATLMAMVPLLVLVFGVLGTLGLLQSEAEQEAVYDAIFGTFFGDVKEIRAALVPFLERIDFRALGVGATLALLVVAARLFLMVEQAYSDIFEVRIDRRLVRRILNFYFSITAVPAVLVFSFEGALRMGLGNLQTPLISMLQFGLLLAALKFFPCTHVRWGPALLGAFTSWALMELGAFGFTTYVQWSYADPDYPLRAFYGSLILIPVFLLWLYILWLVVLLGVEVAHIAQNYGSLVAAEREAAERERRRLRSPSLDNALEVLAHVARKFCDGDGSMTVKELAEYIDLPPRDLYEIADVLVEAGLLIHTGTEGKPSFLIARPPEQIHLGDVARQWRSLTLLHGGEPQIAEEIEDALRLRGTLAEATERWLPPEPEPLEAIPVNQ